MKLRVCWRLTSLVSGLLLTLHVRRQLCGLKPVTCRRLTCGNFTVPANSTGAYEGATLSSGQNALLLYNQNLTITCANNFLLSTSDAEECEDYYQNVVGDFVD